MDSKIEAVLAEYEAREEGENEMFRRRRAGEATPQFTVDDLLIPIGRDVGTMLNMLIKSTKAKTILEVGASYGNSTVWFAEAARETGGKVLSLELAQNKVDYGKAMLEKAGLADYVEFFVGDAVASIRSMSSITFDFVLIDIWKDLYIPAFDALYPKLAEGALIAADNMLSPPQSVADAKTYRRYVRAQPNIESVLLDIGQGVELSRFATTL